MNDIAIESAFARGLKPEPILTVSEWADLYREIPDDMSEPGRWRTSRAPYLKAVMDDFSPHSPVTKIVVQKASQLGFTEAILNVMFYYMHYVPSTQMVIYPTVDIAMRTSKGRIEKSIRRMPALKDMVGERRQKDSSNTILTKEYPGGQMFLSGANSPASLSSTPVKIILMDEVDRFPEDCGGEGDPTKLAEKRTSTYSSTKKIGYISTPVAETTSITVAEYMQSDQRHCYVPCPHCQHMQTLIFENLVYEVKGKDAHDAKYKCCSCERPIDEGYKTEMLERHEWRAHAPENEKSRGYFINGLYAPAGWTGWTEIADEYEKAKGDQSKEKVFINTRKGMPYVTHGEQPDVEKVFLKRESYDMGTCPKGVLFLTMGADVQDNRIEAEVVGWGANHESWSIEYAIFDGDTNGPEVWEALRKYILASHFPVTGSDLKLPVQVAFIDSGYRTQKVYNFIRSFAGSRVFAIKGRADYDRMVSTPAYVDVMDARTNRKIKNGISIYHIGVSLLKEDIYSNIQLPKPTEHDGEFPEWYCHFPEYDLKHFESLCSEKCVLTEVKGRLKKEWVKVVERNEVLDVRVYARAAASLYGFDSMNDEKFKALYTEIYRDKPRSEIQDLNLGKKRVMVKRRTGSFMGG